MVLPYQRLQTFPQAILNQDIFIAGTAYKVIGILQEEKYWIAESDEELYIPLMTGAQDCLEQKLRFS